MLIDSPVPPGSSGSPLFARDGRALGMVYEEEMIDSMYISLPAGIGRAIPISIVADELRNMAEDHGLRISQLGQK